MTSHFVLLVLFGILTSLVFTFIGKDTAKERLKYFLWLMASFVLLSVVAAWLMYPFPL